MQKKFIKIKDAAIKNRIIWGKHSYVRINERFITKDEIIKAINVGELIEGTFFGVTLDGTLIENGHFSVVRQADL